jgi:inorganic pyrophosphatase/exopolyphosphatase
MCLQITGVLLAAIISDTLNLKSSTTTKACKNLSFRHQYFACPK